MIRKQEGVEGSREVLRTDEEKLRDNYLDRWPPSREFNPRLPKMLDSFHHNKSCNENFGSHGVTVRILAFVCDAVLSGRCFPLL